MRSRMPKFLRRPPKDEPLPKGGLWSGWVIFSLLVVLSFGLLLVRPPLGLIFLGLILFYLMRALYIIKEPEVAILFRFGQAVRELSAGWWFTIWPIHSVDGETKARQVLHADEEGEPMPEKETQDLFYIDKGGEIAIRVKMRVFFRLVNVRQALDTYGGLNKVRSRADIEATAFAALRTALGTRRFSELLKDKGRIEKEIEDLINEELADGGYKVESIDIYDYEEDVRSRAGRIKTIAEADAYRAGKMTKAVAEPLRGNYPAAITQSVDTLATTAREINEARLKAGRYTRRERTEGRGETGETEVEGLLGALQEFLSRKEG